eukprot:3858574-Ditylum_brightwellii.AAC.2
MVIERRRRRRHLRQKKNIIRRDFCTICSEEARSTYNNHNTVYNTIKHTGHKTSNNINRSNR